jgi:hypothetical protein
MDQFVAKHADKLQGTLSCFDRVLFRGYLPFFSGYAMARFLETRGVYRRDVKRFVLTQAYRLKDHARQTAAREGRPAVDPCRTFSLRWREGAAFIQSARRKCLILYYYFLDRDFGLIHVRLQTWFPLQRQVYVNGHEWLARKLTQHGVRYTKHDNAFLWLEDFPRAQRFADRFVSLPWVALLDRDARRVNPLLRDVLTPMQYYWMTTQSEYATDLVFKEPPALDGVLPRPAGAQHPVLFGPGGHEFLGAEMAREIRGRGGHGPRRPPGPGARMSGQTPHEAELAEDVRQGRVDPPGGDGHQRPGGVSRGPAGPPPRAPAHRVGSSQEECGLPLPVPRRVAPEQRAVSQRVGPGRGSDVWATRPRCHHHPEALDQSLQSRGSARRPALYRAHEW